MPNTFKVGPLYFHMYGLMIAIGLVAATLVSLKRAKKQGLSKDVVYDMLTMTLIGAVLGTRILYYITVLPEICKDPTILWDFSNGYVVYGGLIGGVLANFIYFKRKNLSFLEYADLVIPQVALGQAFGRIGCLFAGCCYGKETDLPIGFVYHTSEFAPTGVPLIPTQIISSLGDLLLFVLLLLYSKKTKIKGRVFSGYILLYSVGRFLVEFLRGDEGRGIVVGLSTSQIIAVIVFVIGVGIYANLPKFSRQNEEEKV